MTARQSLRIVMLSDTHMIYRQPIPPGDVLIHAGDSEYSASEMNAWAKTHPHSHVLAVSGNMDWRLAREHSMLKNVTYLQDSHVVISGVKIYGSPWTPEFVGVFQLNHDQQARDVWNRVPSDVDVLISHGPPKGILDITSRGKGVGDSELMSRVSQIKPRLHCFGHVHESYGTYKNEHTLFCNVAVFNGHSPIVVDVPFDKKWPAVVV